MLLYVNYNSIKLIFTYFLKFPKFPPLIRWVTLTKLLNFLVSFSSCQCSGVSCLPLGLSPQNHSCFKNLEAPFDYMKLSFKINRLKVTVQIFIFLFKCSWCFKDVLPINKVVPADGGWPQHHMESGRTLGCFGK